MIVDVIPLKVVHVSSSLRNRIGLPMACLAVTAVLGAVAFNQSEATIFFAARGLQVIIVSALAIVLNRGKFAKSVAGALIGAILADIPWIIYVWLNNSVSLLSIAINPFVWIGIIAFATATAPNRKAAIGTGWLLIVIVGIALVWSFVEWEDYQQKANPGLIINGLTRIIVAACTFVSGCIGMVLVVLARLIYEQETARKINLRPIRETVR